MKYLKLWRLLLGVLLSQPLLTLADPGYAFDSNGGADRSNAKWMSLVGDEVLLSDMSLPGTHDSATWVVSDASPQVKTQSMSIVRQLQAGVRVFDIRCRYINNGCDIYHGGIYLGTNLDGVLADMTAFLSANPTEAVVMMVNNPENYGGGATDGAPANNTPGVSFSSMFKSKYVDKYSSYFYWKSYGPAPAVPKLGQARKKIVVMQNFGASDICDSTSAWIGLPSERWSGCLPNRISKQNDFAVTTNWDLYDKWIKVKSQLDLANSSTKGDGKIFMNFLSASGGSMPYFVASGKSSPGTNDPALLTGAVSNAGDGPYLDFPRISCTAAALCSIAFRGTNMLTYTYVSGSAMATRAGIVLADFPDLMLIEGIIGLNTGWNGAALAGWGAGSPPTLHEFVTTTSGKLNYRVFNGTTWSAWSDLGGSLVSAPAAASWGYGRLDVFAIGTDKALWHRAFNGTSWSTWESLGGYLTSAPAVASWGNGRLDVFARGGDRALYHRGLVGGTWSDWLSLGGLLTSAPAVASWGDSRLDVFARDTGHSLSHIYFNSNGWSAWESLGGVLTSAPGASSWGSNRLDVFVRDTGNGLSRLSYDNKWYPWESMGGVLNAAAPATASRGSHRVDVIVRDVGDGLHRRSFDNGTWSDWTIP